MTFVCCGYKSPSLHSPCSVSSACRGCRMPSLRTPCSVTFVCCGCRLPSLHSPCNTPFLCRGCSTPSLRTPCNATFVCRGRRMPSLHTPCKVSSIFRACRTPSLRTPCNAIFVCRGCISTFLSFCRPPLHLGLAHVSAPFRSELFLALEHFLMPRGYLPDHSNSSLPILFCSHSGLMRHWTTPIAYFPYCSTHMRQLLQLAALTVILRLNFDLSCSGLMEHLQILFDCICSPCPLHL